MMMTVLTAVLTAPMLAVTALGLPLLITMCVCGARLLKKAPRVRRESVRSAMKTRGVWHFVIAALTLALIPVSMIGSAGVYVCAAGALLLVLGGVILGCRAKRYRASHAAAVTEIVFAALFAVILAAFLAVVQFKLHIAIF